MKFKRGAVQLGCPAGEKISPFWEFGKAVFLSRPFIVVLREERWKKKAPQVIPGANVVNLCQMPLSKSAPGTWPAEVSESGSKSRFSNFPVMEVVVLFVSYPESLPRTGFSKRFVRKSQKPIHFHAAGAIFQ